jgi:hypothetical protein
MYNVDETAILFIYLKRGKEREQEEEEEDFDHAL